MSAHTSLAPAQTPRGRARTDGAARVRRVYLEDWDTFAAEAEKLYVEHPAHVRDAPPRDLVAPAPRRVAATRPMLLIFACAVCPLRAPAASLTRSTLSPLAICTRARPACRDATGLALTLCSPQPRSPRL